MFYLLVFLFSSRGYRVRFLPPYSPGFNPIELASSAIKSIVWRECYAPCSPDTDTCRPTRLRSDSVSPPSVTLGTPGTALHNLSQDTGDLFTSLSFLLYLLIFPMPRSDYLLRVFLMFSLIYFCSSSGSSINSSTIVGSTQTKNLVVFQFRLRANLFYSSLRLHRQLPSSRSSDSAIYYRLTVFALETIGHRRLPSEPISNLRSL